MIVSKSSDLSQLKEVKNLWKHTGNLLSRKTSRMRKLAKKLTIVRSLASLISFLSRQFIHDNHEYEFSRRFLSRKFLSRRFGSRRFLSILQEAKRHFDNFNTGLFVFCSSISVWKIGILRKSNSIKPIDAWPKSESNLGWKQEFDVYFERSYLGR